MRNFFSPDNPATRFLSTFFDLMVLNFLFMLSCIPIFTMGASLTALYSVTLKMLRHEEPSIAKDYIKAFKSNFKQSTLVWIPIMFIFAFLVSDLYIVYNVIGEKYLSLQYPVWIMFYLVISVLIYVFPMIATYDNSTRQIIKNCILISFGNLPTSIFLTVIHFGLYRLLVSSWTIFVIAGSFFLFFGFAAVAYFCSIFLLRVFQKYTTENLSADAIDNTDDSQSTYEHMTANKQSISEKANYIPAKEDDTIKQDN